MQNKIYKKVSLTVGIPVYNERENIGRLLGDLFTQKQRTFRLESILIISDGSTDNSVKLVKSLKNPRINMVEHKKREGKVKRLNEIYNSCNSDILIILDADIRIRDVYFLEKLVKPIRQKKADLVCCRMKELSGKGFFEKAINVGCEMKLNIFEDYKDGINIFTCRGPVRAQSRKIYKQLRYPEIYCEDMYTFLYCGRERYTYYYSRDTEAFYKSPTNMQDHLKQSNRFLGSKNILEKYFSKKTVDASLRIPVGISMKHIAGELIRHPVYMAGYLTILIYTRLVNIFVRAPSAKWEMVTSSKNLETI